MIPFSILIPQPPTNPKIATLSKTSITQIKQKSVSDLSRKASNIRNQFSSNKIRGWHLKGSSMLFALDLRLARCEATSRAPKTRMMNESPFLKDSNFPSRWIFSTFPASLVEIPRARLCNRSHVARLLAKFRVFLDHLEPLSCRLPSITNKSSTNLIKDSVNLIAGNQIFSAFNEREAQKRLSNRFRAARPS